MENRLYVGNLSFDASEDDLQELFSQAGAVTDIVVMRDKFSGRSRGFGFVTMQSGEEAQNAVEKLNDYELAGRKLQVNVARPKEERSEGGFRPRMGGMGGGAGRKPSFRSGPSRFGGGAGGDRRGGGGGAGRSGGGRGGFSGGRGRYGD